MADFRLAVDSTGNNQASQGEVEAPIKGEMRLQSDHNFARNSRTSCEWQSFVSEYLAY